MSSLGGGGKGKILEINLTDESDAFFLYSLRVSEEDFHVLKREQNLLVDFHQFPLKLIELLEQCISCKYESNPRFIAALDCCSRSGSPHLALLNIIETNSFRNITHLSLQVTAGDDASIKKYLAGLVKLYKEEGRGLKAALEETKSSLSEQLHLALTSKDQLKSDFESVKSYSSSSLQELKLFHAEEMNREKEKSLVAMREIQARFDQEKRDILNRLESQIATMTGKIEVLEATNGSLQASKIALESNEKDLTMKLHSAREQVDSFRQEVMDLRKDNKELDTIKFEQEKEINQLRMGQKASDQQIRDREELYRKNVELLESTSSQKVKLQEQVDSSKAISTKLEETVRKAGSEINKV